MAKKKNAEVKTAETEQEPGFFSDYGYGNGTAITLHNPPQTQKTAKNTKIVKAAKSKRK